MYLEAELELYATESRLIYSKITIQKRNTTAQGYFLGRDWAKQLWQGDDQLLSNKGPEQVPRIDLSSDLNSDPSNNEHAPLCDEKPCFGQ